MKETNEGSGRRKKNTCDDVTVAHTNSFHVLYQSVL